MHRAVALIIVLALPGCREQPSAAPARSSHWAPLNAVDDADGWQRFTDPPAFTPESAAGVFPGQSTPAAAVAHFYASLLRGDERYREVLAPGNRAYDHIDDVLARYRQWRFEQVQLRRVKMLDDDRAGVSVHLTIVADGREDEGTDEVELIRIDGRWFVYRPPI